MYDVVSDERLIAAELDLHDLKTWDDHGVRMEKGYLYEDRDEGHRIDLGFFRKVRQVAKDIPRSGYADSALIGYLNAQQTNLEITGIRESVDEAIARWDKKTPINMASLIMERCAAEVLDLITEKLDAARLEKLIKWYFRRIGASSVDIPAKNESGKEGDADIVATFEPIRTIIYVQTKFFVETTDEWVVE